MKSMSMLGQGMGCSAVVEEQLGAEGRKVEMGEKKIMMESLYTCLKGVLRGG